MLRHAKPVETSHSEKRAHRHTIRQFAHAGLNIAAKLHRLQIGPDAQRLRIATH